MSLQILILRYLFLSFVCWARIKETLKDNVTAIRSCGMLGHVMKILIKINKSKCVLEVH